MSSALPLVRRVLRRATGAVAFVIAAACRDATTDPHASPAVPAAPLVVPQRAALDQLESPPGGSAELSASGEAPLAGGDAVVGHYPTLTILELTAHQDFTITNLPPLPAGGGHFGLAGRVSAFGCTHQGESYLSFYPDGGGFGLAYSGCTPGGMPVPGSSVTDTVAVSGVVHWGYGYDAACPFPDDACASYDGSSGVTVRRLSATLAIRSDSLRAGLLRAWPRHQYLLEAVATPATMGRFPTPVLPLGAGWSFAPDSGDAYPLVCDGGGGRVCYASFTRPGLVSMVALVNGEQVTSPALRVQTPGLSLSLSRDTVAAGDTVVATAHLVGADPSTLLYYDVTPGPFAAAEPPSAGGETLPPCAGTSPAPMRCWMVLTTPGRATVELGAMLERNLYLIARASVYVTGSRRSVRITTKSSGLLFPTTTALNKPRPACHVAYVPQYRDLQVGVYDDDTTRPIPNRDVRLDVGVEEGEGGHSSHAADRPAGGFVLTAGKGRTPSQRQLNVNTGPTGIARVSYEAAEFGGRHDLSGTSDGARRGDLPVTVGVDLAALGAGHWQRYGDGRKTHPSVWYGLPVMNGMLLELAARFYAQFNADIEYNDYSLQYGGRFETGGTWEGLDHCDHRWGKGTDVHTNGGTRPLPIERIRYIHRAWAQLAGNDSAVVVEGDHYHLKPWSSR